MSRASTNGPNPRGFFGRILRRAAAPQSALPASSPLALLDRLYAGESPDYCLYLRPPAGGPVVKSSPLSIDLEEVLAKALDPLPMVALDECGANERGARLPDEAFLMLARRARLLCIVPMSDAAYVQRLRLIQEAGPIGRCIFVMPEEGTLGSVDWAAIWPAAQQAAATIGIALSGYTAGGWLFRIDASGKSVTFRPIVNPHPQKVARAIESICGEMS